MPRGPLVIEDFESATGWTVIDADSTENLAVSTTSLHGTYSLEFDKAGAATETTAGAYKTLTRLTSLRDPWEAMPYAQLVWNVYVSDTTNVAYAFIRLGKVDADGKTLTNYNEWRYADSNITADQFTRCSAPLHSPYPGGTGMDWADIDTLVAGVMFDDAANTLADIKVDRLSVMDAVPVVSI